MFLDSVPSIFSIYFSITVGKYKVLRAILGYVMLNSVSAANTLSTSYLLTQNKLSTRPHCKSRVKSLFCYLTNKHLAVCTWLLFKYYLALVNYIYLNKVKIFIINLNVRV